VHASKDKVRVMMVTNGFRIEGDVHILAGGRITDSLNSKSKDFFALTDAKVYQLGSSKTMYEPTYLAINREAIACLFPIDEDA
jgi:hypothetical protein